jgi:hypothetical protein
VINNRPVGLWMLPAHVGASRSLLATLQRDFSRLRTLEHPHIARMLELGNNGQQYYVTGERLDGEPLREVLTHLSPERLDVGEADDVVRAIGSALVYAHENDVAHGDVRAENVLVTMDRRFVLTNFLARRVAKIGGRPPRVGDDLKGLARLAAELYTGSTSAHALRAAAHGVVPAARLNAIRAVLESGGKKSPSSVAEFLDAAGLSPTGEGATLRRPAPPQQRSWSLWRLVLPMAGVVALATLVAYHGGVVASAEELKVRGLDALRSVAARVAPATTTTVPVHRDDAALQHAAAPSPENRPAGAEPARPSEPPPEAPPPEASLSEPRPTSSTATPIAPAKPPAKSPPPKHDPPVVSLDVPRIAAREDHMAVAIDIVRRGDVAHESAVRWWTTPDTAHEDTDYARTGRQIVTFGPGATVKRVLIPIVDDGVREGDEVFTVHMSRPSGGVAGAVTATRVTLHDDD